MDPLGSAVVNEVERDCVLDGLDDMANAAATSTVLAIPHAAVGRTLWFAAAQHHAANEEQHGSWGSFCGVSENDPQRCNGRWVRWAAGRDGRGVELSVASLAV